MKKIYQLKLILLTIFLSLYVFAFSAPAFGAQVTYCSHIANVGWLSWVSDGQTSGSPGSSNQMEAVQIKTVGFPSTYHIDYQAHVSYIGWQGWVSDAQTAGTTGQGKAIEAIQIKLRGFPSNYHVKYRAYIQNIGWQGWVSDGATAGTTGQGKAIEALAVEIYADPSIPPEAKITMTSRGQTVYENGTLNLTVTPGGTAHVDFSASRSSDPDGSVVSYQWYISGQPVSTSRDFAYDLGAGTHPIYLEVWDNQGAQGAVGASIVISENQLPVARLSMTSAGQTAYENGTLNLTVAPGGTAHVDFSASRSSDSDGSVVSYQWYISGQPVSTSRDFAYDLGAGTHPIYLEVWDNQGAQGAVGASIIIGENQLPVAGLSMTSQGQTVYENGTLNLIVTPGGTAHVDFSASRSSDPDGSISSYQWRINGQPEYTTRDFDRDFPAGTHDILLEVWDNQGAKGAVGASIIITEDNIVYLDNGIVHVEVDLDQGGYQRKAGHFP